MTDKKLVDQVQKIVTSLSTLDKTKVPTDDKGNLDVKRFNEMDEVKSVKEELVQLGVNTKWLFKNGFVPAGMILKIR